MRDILESRRSYNWRFLLEEKGIEYAASMQLLVEERKAIASTAAPGSLQKDFIHRLCVERGLLVAVISM